MGLSDTRKENSGRTLEREETDEGYKRAQRCS